MSTGDEKPPAEDAPQEGVLLKVTSLGAAAQASVPGLYAWAITVAPAAWLPRAPLAAKLCACAGPLAVAVGILLERAWGVRARAVSVWGLMITSAATWLLVPSALGPLRLDTTRGIAGMVGWALFAFASAAPALRKETQPGQRLIEDSPLKPRTVLRGGDGIYLGVGIVLAVALQAVGWKITVPERALLVRFVALAGGIAIIGASTSIALARHGRHAAPRAPRVRRGLMWLLLLVVLISGGLVLLLRS